MEETKTLQEEYSPTDAKREKVRRVAVAMIDDFPEHPFTESHEAETGGAFATGLSFALHA